MYKRFLEPSKEHFFLFGPRGTGKTTWLKHVYPHSLWINLLQPEELRYYAPYPERLVETIQAHPEKKIIIIDEVQKVPELLSLVHHLIEEKKGWQFILIGSSIRKLKRTGANLLAGRALLKYMFPFIGSELGEDFSLRKALKIGLLPLIWNSDSPEKTLSTYTALYLKEEVQEEGLVRQLGDFARFLEIMSFSHSSIINTTNIARECDIARKTVENYLNVLEDLLLSFTLKVFTKRSKRALSTHPKFYYIDPGIYRSLRPKGYLDQIDEIEGAALEGLVAQHLRVWILSQNESHQLTFWRTRSGAEVDFIVYGPLGFWAIEVKHAKRIHPQDLNGLLSFKEDYPECTPVLLYLGEKKIMQKEILCIPCEEFLKNLHPSKLIL